MRIELRHNQPEVYIHAFVIYPLGVSLRSENEEERRLSKFVAAEVLVAKNSGKILPESSALGIEMMNFLDAPANRYQLDETKVRVFPVYDYNRLKSCWEVSLFRQGREADDSPVYHFKNVVDPPWTGFLRALATSTSSSAERSRTTAASKRARTISPAPGRASAVTSSSQPITKKVTPSAGKNATNSSNAQASTSATLEKESRLMQGVIGNAVKQELKVTGKRPGGFRFTSAMRNLMRR